MTIFRNISNRNGEGTILTNLGSAYLSLKDYLQALECFRQSLTIFQEIGNRNGEGTALGNVGSVYFF
ncbi:MAG: tetratricopeptide repeat protein [Microcoleus sp. SU_5_6]|nr:tetratricopeptide repeat protein [Microcoleus sp. SU_5_6]NJL66526.1 tetratricopeptide repeat protein [Microcoleus sp. SM1_3_4]